MEARLSAVQKRLLLLLFASLVVAVLARPQPDNGRFTHALEEVVSLQSHFVRRDAERALREQAAQQRVLPLEVVAKAASSQRGPRFKAAADAPAITPMSQVRLATLAELRAHAQEGASVPVALPDAQALGASLAWRLARGSSKGGPVTLTGVQLAAGSLTEDDAELEKQVAQLRLESLAAGAQAELSARRVVLAERRVEKRRKRKSRSLSEMEEALVVARATHEEKSALHDDAQQRYDAAAQRADVARKLVSSAQLPQVALALVTLEQGGKTLTLQIPVRLAQGRVAVAPLVGADFSAIREAGLWDEVKSLDVESAAAAIRSHFNWHFNHVELLGVKLSGAKLLQLLPCILPLLLGLLLVRMRRAEVSYSPFTTRVPDSLPRVGLRNRFFEFVGVVLLPLLAVASAGASLLLIDQPPVLPALTAVACLPLGALVFFKLRELREQAVSIVRSHSFPPPA